MGNIGKDFVRNLRAIVLAKQLLDFNIKQQFSSFIKCCFSTRCHFLSLELFLSKLYI